MSRPLRATYRLQFHAGFTFADAEAIVPYLAELGISHLYASPVFAARAGSTHGYDVVDPNRLNPELGTEAAFASLVAALHRAEMGLILDIVPNHMVVHRSNRLLQEALCLGPEGEAARIFDIDWSGGTVSLPVLGGPLEEVLGEIRLDLDEGGLFMAVYHDHAFALRPESAARLLEAAGEASLAGRWRRLEAEPRASAFADAALATARLAGDGALQAALDRADIGAILAEQRWTLADWRSAAETLSHRRFFNITELIGVRVEDGEVFERTHRLAVELVARGDVDGLRIDHIDGLADPAGYARRLRAAIGPDAPILVEKILGPDEVLPDWPVDGTTGYERLNEINRLFVDGEAYRRLDRHLVEEGHLAGSFPERLAAAKRQVLGELFRPEVDALAAAGARLEAGMPEADLREALVTLLVHFPVYRSYVDQGGWSDGDRAAWDEALARARRLDGDAAAARAGRLREALEQGGAEALPVLIRFQQLSGPAMAKGLEDTELYRSVALTSVNEVGSEPEMPSATPAEAHSAVEARVARGDRSLIPLATHDTKRGPDTRARINALGLDPEAWIETDRRWRAAAAPLREGGAPDALDAWLVHQTAVGAWPVDEERLNAYLEKAMREAKRHTRWEAPEAGYEGAARRYAAAFAAGEHAEAVAERARGLERAARTMGLAQTILQLTLPGVPDVYQGTELWDHSLVDPDNRRPVDYDLRRRLLAEGGRPSSAAEGGRPSSAAEGAPPSPAGEGGLLSLGEDGGGAKLRVTAALLGLRRRDPGLFVDGPYEPLPGAGEEVFAFRRRSPGTGAVLLVAVPLRGRALRVALAADDAGPWRDVLAGAPCQVEAGASDLPRDRPFLVLHRPGREETAGPG